MEQAPGLVRFHPFSGVPAFAGMTVGLREGRQGIEAEQGYPQVVPVGIVALDQLDLPASMPVLHPLLPDDRRLDVFERFEVDEPLDAIAAGEAANGPNPMFVETPGEIGRNADIDRSVFSACQDIDESAHRFTTSIASTSAKAARCLLEQRGVPGSRLTPG
jgi:hypothetical protein